MKITTDYRIVQPDPEENIFYVERRRELDIWEKFSPYTFGTLNDAKRYLDNVLKPKPEPKYFAYP